jgi:uncharacterized protein (TIGR00369 family)
MDAREPLSRAGVPDGFEPFSPRDDFIGYNGPLWLKPQADGLRVGLLIEQRHCNPMGVCHGGMMMTLADMVMGMGCGFITKLRFPHPTISMNCDFIRGPKAGQFVEGMARISRRTRNLIFANCELTADGEVMLTGSGVFKMPDPDKIPERFKSGPDSRFGSPV